MPIGLRDQTVTPSSPPGFQSSGMVSASSLVDDSGMTSPWTTIGSDSSVNSWQPSGVVRRTVTVSGL